MTVWHFDVDSKFGRSDEEEIFFRELNSDSALSSSDLTNGGFKIESYDKIVYLDLNSIHEGDAPFTMSIDISDLNNDIGTNPKPVNYFTFGYHIRGRSCTALTVGRAANSDRLVLGTITEAGVLKASLMPDYPEELEIIQNNMYRLTLVVDYSLDDENRIQLYAQTLQEDGTVGVPYIVSSSQEMSLRNFSFVDRKVILGSSAWTNEPEWEGLFDLVRMKVHNSFHFTANSPLPPIFYEGSPYIPRHHSLENITSVERNAFRQATTNDVVRVQFHSLYRVYVERVSVFMGNVRLEYTSVDKAFVYNGVKTRLYTYQTTVTESALSGPLLEYQVNLSNFNEQSFTFSAPMALVSDQATYMLYTSPTLLVVRNAPTRLDYKIVSVGMQNVVLQLVGVEDEFTANVTGYLKMMGYRFTFRVSLVLEEGESAQTKELAIDTMQIGDTLEFNELLEDRFYNISASVTNLAGLTLENVPPNPGKFASPIETIEDTVPPVIVLHGNPVSSIKDVNSKAGIRVQAETYDNTANDRRAFTFYVNAFETELTGLGVEELYDRIKTNHVSQQSINENTSTGLNNALVDIHFYTNESGAHLPIQVETPYYIYMMSEDFAENRVTTTSYMHVVDNTLQFLSAEFDNEHKTIGTTQDNLVLTWTSEYAVDPSAYNVRLFGDTSVAPQSSNGIDWTLTYPITDSTSAGSVTFSVSQAVDIQETSSFTDASTGTRLYVENRLPTMINGTVIPQVSEIALVSNKIDDFTIRSNQSPFSVQIDIFKTSDPINSMGTFSESYTNYSDFSTANISFANLEEGEEYKVTYALSNVFVERRDGVLKSKVDTTIDSPVVYASITESNQNGQLAVEVNSASYASDPTTAFDLYAVVLQDEVTMANVNAVIGGLTPLNTAPLAPGQNHAIAPLKSNFTQFRNSSGETVPIKPSENAYTLYLIADDGNAITPLGIGLDVDFLEGVADSVRVERASGGFFVRDGDAVTMTWTTPFISDPSDFSVSMMGVSVTPEYTEEGKWKAQSVFDKSSQPAGYRGGLYTFTLEYLGSTYNTSSFSVPFVDLEAPTFTPEVVDRNGTSIHMRITQIADLYTDTVHPFQAYLTAQKEGEDPINTATFTDSIFNIENKIFVLNGLSENTVYTVSGTVIDPAGNKNTVAVSNGGIVRTRESVLPTVTIADDSFVHLHGESTVSVSDVVAMDEHNDFKVYVGLFQSVEEDPEVSTEFMHSMNGSGAVLMFSGKANTPYTVTANISKFVPYVEGAWSSKSRSMAYNTTKRGVVMVVDDDDNSVVRKLTFQVGPAPVPDWLPTVEVRDDTGLLAATDASVSFMQSPDGQILGLDGSGSGNIFTVEVSPGVDNATALSTNAVVNPVSLNMGVIESVVIPPAVEISNTFSYGLWINLQTESLPEEPISLLNVGDAEVIVVENNQVTVSSGRTQVFTADLPTNEWTNLMVTSGGDDFKLFVNTEEIKSKVTTVDEPIRPIGANLYIGTVPDLLIDDIRIYNEALTSEEVEVSVQSGSKQVHLSFDEGDLPEFSLTFEGDNLLLNGRLPDDTTTLFYNTRYSFYQNDNTNIRRPVHFVRSDGSFLESIDIEYFLDNVSVGHDATAYINGFEKAMFRKIVVTPVTMGSTRVYFGTYGSDPYTTFFTISTNPPYLVNTAKIAATTAVTSTTPSYSADTPVGKLAVEFDSSKSQHISMEGETFQNMNMNNMTLSSWVKVSEVDTSKPIIARKDAFEMGLDEEGLTYISMQSDNLQTLIGKIDSVEFTGMSTIRITNMRVSPPSSTRYYYVFASLEQIREKSKLIETAIEHASDSALVYTTSTNNAQTIDILDFDRVMDSEGGSVSTKSILIAYIYVVALEKENSYTLGDENQIKEVRVRKLNVRTLANFVSTSAPSAESPFALVKELTVISSDPVDSFMVFPLKPSEVPGVTYRYTLSTIYDNGNVYNLSGLGNRPALQLNAGDKLILDLELFVHPVIITDQYGSAVAGVVNNDAYEGVLEWVPTFPGTYRYGCSSHNHSSPMGNTIVVADKLRGTSVTQAGVSAFANELITSGAALSEGYNQVNSTNNNVFYSGAGLNSGRLYQLANLSFTSAFSLLNTSSSVDLTPGDNIMYCLVALADGSYRATTSFLNFVDLDESMLLQMTERGLSNRYYEFSSDKHTLRLRHYDDTLSAWYGVQLDYLFDFSEIGAVYEYEYAPLWSSSDQYHALMFYDERDAHVTFNTQHAHGFWAKGNANKAMFENTEGWPTWHDGTENRSTSESGAKWPRYQRLTVIQAKSTQWTGQVNNKTLNPANTYSEANELFFEFFSDPERTSLVASGTGSQLRSYDHNDSHFHRSNKLYMTLMYHQADPNGGGLEFGNLVRIQ